MLSVFASLRGDKQSKVGGGAKGLRWTNRHDETVGQEGTVEGQIGAKSDWPAGNQGKSREIKPPCGKFFSERSGELRTDLRKLR